jgi:regulator of protease activity HflC (stomatin/prohibitin superfamily)
LILFKGMFNHVSDLMRTNARARALVAVAGATGMTLYASVFTVPAGHIGVESLFGDVYERSYSPGIHVSHPLTRVKCYDIRVQNTALKCESVTADGLAIQSNLAVRWRLDPAHATQTRRTVAGNVETTILTPMLVDAVTRATSRHGVSALFDATTRANIGTQMRETLGDKCSAYGIVILDVMVNRLQPPESVEQAVQQKMTAEQDAERANYTMNKKRIELAFETERAQFEADRNMMLARAEADRLKLLAASEAERMLLLADAEAQRRILEGKGVRAFQDAINASTSPRVLEWRKIEAMQKLYENPGIKFAFFDPKETMLMNVRDLIN